MNGDELIGLRKEATFGFVLIATNDGFGCWSLTPSKTAPFSTSTTPISPVFPP